MTLLYVYLDVLFMSVHNGEEELNFKMYSFSFKTFMNRNKIIKLSIRFFGDF